MQVPGPTAALKVSGSQASQMRTVLVCAPRSRSESRRAPPVFVRKFAWVTVPFLSVAMTGSFLFAAAEGEAASTVSFLASDFGSDCANPLRGQSNRAAPKPTTDHLMLCSFTTRKVLTFIQLSLRFLPFQVERAHVCGRKSAKVMTQNALLEGTTQLHGQRKESELH